MLDEAEELILSGVLPFSLHDFLRERDEWASLGYPPIHHTDSFRKEYRPSYRVIAKKFLPFLDLFALIDKKRSESYSVALAIEGGSASGKSTLGEILREVYGCTVLHMDDFFLRPEQRTKERLAEVGGNVDYERFLSEVLIPLKEGRTIEYRRFDCTAMAVMPAVMIEPCELTVIEGAYSMHPALARYYDLKVFLDIGKEFQMSRIEKRNSPEMAKRFFSEWIPLEDIYFSKTKPIEACDLVIKIDNRFF